ncbi:MAG: MFS transporter [Candidatus Paceibacterota bacterium]
MEIEKNELNAASIAVTKLSRRSSIVRILTGNDIIFWGADAFISVAIALFVVTFIEGATILNVGIALMIHRVVNAIASVPVGRFFDKHKGYLDEILGLTLACFASGFFYMLLSFSTQIWQLYLVMLFLGICSAINLSSWRIIFYSHINQEQIGQTLGVYQMLYSLGIGLFLAIGGFTGERYGFDRVLLIGGLLMMLGSTLPILIRHYFVEDNKG